MSEQLKIYSAAELARYHRGEMTATEMHAIEKAALDDPFLADALEGYAYTDAPEADLDELRQRLAAKKTEAKIIPLQPKKNTWLRVAAAVVVIGGGAYVFNMVNKKAEHAPLAKTEKITEPAAQTETVTAPSSSGAIADSSSVKVTQGLTSNSSTITYADVKQPVQKWGYTTHSSPAFRQDAAAKGDSLKQGIDDDYRTLADGETTDQQKDRAKIAAGAKVAQQNANYYDLRKDEKQVALKKEKEKTEDTKLVQQNKEERKFTAKTQTATASAEIASATTVETVEIKDKNAAYYKRSQGAVTATRLNPDSTTDFDRYVTMNNRLPAPEEKNNSYRGTVVLSFKVNRKGKPVKIRTENTVCGECDKEAIRLLKEGPAWEYKPDNARHTVSIPF